MVKIMAPAKVVEGEPRPGERTQAQARLALPQAGHGKTAKKPKKHHLIRQIGYNADAGQPSRTCRLPAMPIQPLVKTRTSMADYLKDAMAREIDEELRREQLLKLWDKYGMFVLAAAVVAILGVGLWKGYEYRRAQANEAASNQYFIALGELAANRSEDAQKALENLAAGAPPGYSALARLRLAAQDAASGNTLDAVSAYDQLVKDKDVDPILQDFARLQIAMLKFDTIPFSELRTQLSPLANDRSPWRYTARELLGMGAAKAGLVPEARNHFQRLLADRTTPPGIAERARIMVALLEEQDRAQAAPGAEEKPGASPKAEPSEAKGKAVSGKSK
jgi:hypothetical protein